MTRHASAQQWLLPDLAKLERADAEALFSFHVRDVAVSPRELAKLVVGRAQRHRSILLGGIATRFPKQQLNWDEKKLAFSNSEAATAFVKREYRKGWEVKGL